MLVLDSLNYSIGSRQKVLQYTNKDARCFRSNCRTEKGIEVGGVGLAARKFHHNPFGMCATGIAIAILNDLKSKCDAAPMTRCVLVFVPPFSY